MLFVVLLYRLFMFLCKKALELAQGEFVGDFGCRTVRGSNEGSKLGFKEDSKGSSRVFEGGS